MFIKWDKIWDWAGPQMVGGQIHVEVLEKKGNCL